VNAINAFRHGLREASGHLRLALLLYGTHVLLAFPAAYAFQAMLGREFGGSLAPERLLSGFDFSVWADFLRDHGDALRSVTQMALGTGVLAILVGPFLAGGTLAMLGVRAEPFSAAAFFRNCGAFFVRLLRLLLIFGGCAIVLLVVGFVLLGGIVSTVDDNAVSELPAIMIGSGGIILLLVLLSAIFLAADYARIMVVRQNSRGMIRAALGGFGFVLRNFLSVAVLQFFLLAVLGLLMILYLGIDRLLPAESGATILLLLLAQQCLIFGRILLRIAGLSAQLALFEDRREQPLVLYGWADAPGTGYQTGVGAPA
jgi:hypothetical protein